MVTWTVRGPVTVDFSTLLKAAPVRAEATNASRLSFTAACVESIAVVEHDVRANLDGPYVVVGIGGDRFRQISVDRSVGSEGGELVVDGRGILEPGRVPAALRRVETVYLGPCRHGELPASYRRSLRDAGVGGSQVLGGAGAVPGELLGVGTRAEKRCADPESLHHHRRHVETFDDPWACHMHTTKSGLEDVQIPSPLVASPVIKYVGTHEFTVTGRRALGRYRAGRQVRQMVGLAAGVPPRGRRARAPALCSTAWWRPHFPTG